MSDPTSSAILFRIVAPNFSAGGQLVDAKVAFTAPVLSYMRGWTARQVKDYCDKKGWKVERVGPSLTVAE
jgi:hypothetical protein